MIFGVQNSAKLVEFTLEKTPNFFFKIPIFGSKKGQNLLKKKHSNLSDHTKGPQIYSFIYRHRLSLGYKMEMISSALMVWGWQIRVSFQHLPFFFLPSCKNTQPQTLSVTLS